MLAPAPVVTETIDHGRVHPAEADQPGPAAGRRLAAPIAVGLGLFLGGNRVVDLTSVLDADAYLWTTVAGLIIRYAGAITVALCSIGLVRRLVVRMDAGEEAVADRPVADRPVTSRRRTSPALVLVVVGLALMAAAEVQLPVALYQLDAGSYSGPPFPGMLGSMLQIFFRVSAYLGPVLTAVGACLAIRRLEDAATAQPPGTSPASTDLVTDLDE